MQDLLKNIVEELVDAPDNITVSKTVSDGGNTVVLTVRTAAYDMGKIIGKKGKTAYAIRTILEAIAAKYGYRIILEIAEQKVVACDGGD